MGEYIKVMVEGDECYLNDLLVELAEYTKDMEVEVEGVKFTLLPKDALEFTMDYGRDTYSQNAVQAATSLESMRECEYSCGFVKELK